MQSRSAGWISHVWVNRLATGPGVPLIRHVCRRCGCAFVDDLATNRMYPLRVIDSPFDNLMRGPRWLIEPCPKNKARVH
jgi:hypothetical protein